MSEKSKVVVEGFLLSVHVPTEGRLSVVIDASGLSWDSYRNLVTELQDKLAEIDEEYALRDARGRGLGARYRRVSVGKVVSRRRVLSFIPYPSRFANILRTIRRDVYERIGRDCLVLQVMSSGRFRHNLYLLPFANAPSFMAFINRVNERIDSLNKEILGFRGSRWYAEIKSIIGSYGLDSAVIDSEVIIPSVSVDVTPLQLDPTVIERVIEERYKKVFEKISAEEKAGLERLRIELEKKRREVVIKAIESLRSEINEVVKRIIAGKRLKDVKKDIERLRKMAHDVGLEAIATTVLTPLLEVVENPMMAESILGSNDLSKEINGRIDGLIRTL